VGCSTLAAVASPAQGNLPLPQLSDIESFMVDVENLTHFVEWLRRFEISLLCAATKISEKEKTMVLVKKNLLTALQTSLLLPPRLLHHLKIVYPEEIFL
jgi:hypothetical protein